MINFDDRRPLAALASRVSQTMSIVPNTPLVALVNGVRLERAENVDSLIEQIHKNKNHEEAMEQLANDTARVIRERQSYIRNTVLANIEDIYEAVQENVKQDDVAPLPYKVVSQKIPSLLTHEILQDTVAHYESAALHGEKTPVGFPAMTDGELTAVLVNAGGPRLQELLFAFVDAFQLPISAIYDKVFRGMKEPNYPQASDLVAPAYVQADTVEKVIGFFLAKAFHAEPDDRVRSSLPVYNEFLMSVMNRYGKAIIGKIKQLEHTLSRRTVNLAIVQEGRFNVYVCTQHAYEALVNSTNSNTMLGLALTGALENLRIDENGALELSDLRKEEAERAATNALAAQRMKHSAEQHGQALRLVLKEIGHRITNGDLVCPEGMTKDDVLRRIHDVSADYNGFTMDQLYFLVREIVCKGVYPGSGALEFIRAMDSVEGAENGREAATLATATAIIRWYMGQLRG